MKKQSIAIIGVIAFVLAVAVGYALFSDALQITGTAKAGGNFDYDLSVGEITSTGVSENGVTAVLSEDNDKLTITVDKLLYPGAEVVIPGTVVNTGTIDGKLISLDESGIPTNSVIKVDYEGPGVSDAVLGVGDEPVPFTITITWPEEFATDEEDASNVNDFTESISFTVDFKYQQPTE